MNLGDYLTAGYMHLVNSYLVLENCAIYQTWQGHCTYQALQSVYAAYQMGFTVTRLTWNTCMIRGISIADIALSYTVDFLMRTHSH